MSVSREVESDDSSDDLPHWSKRIPTSDEQWLWWMCVDYDAERAEWEEGQQLRKGLDPSHSYMRNVDLVPPPEEFETGREYIKVLRLFERAPASEVAFYRFNPTLQQRRLNAKVLAEWASVRKKPRSADDDKRKRKRALGLLNWRCFTGTNIGWQRAPALALLDPDCHIRDVQTRDAMRFLAPYVNEGWLTGDEMRDAIVDASYRNKHIPENKSRAFVEHQVDTAINRFTEPVDWESLDAND